MQASTKNSVRQEGRSMEFHASVGQVRPHHSPPSVGRLPGFLIILPIPHHVVIKVLALLLAIIVLLSLLFKELLLEAYRQQKQELLEIGVPKGM